MCPEYEGLGPWDARLDVLSHLSVLTYFVRRKKIQTIRVLKKLDALNWDAKNFELYSPYLEIIHIVNGSLFLDSSAKSS